MLADEQVSAGCPLDAAGLQHHCKVALEQQKRLDIEGETQIEISVQMLDVKSMRSLNQQYRDKDSATNVLSFESGMPLLGTSQEQKLLVLGDLVFCPDVIASEAELQGKSEARHWAHLVVHGTLHLCGYDHVDPAEATEMEQLEIRILSGIGVSNPYQTQAAQ